MPRGSPSPRSSPTNPTRRSSSAWPPFSYKPDAPEFICLAAVLRAPPETRITFVWIYKTQNIEIDRAKISVSGSQAVNARLTRGDKPWPLGDYVVHIYIDDQKQYKDAAPFIVKE